MRVGMRTEKRKQRKESKGDVIVCNEYEREKRRMRSVYVRRGVYKRIKAGLNGMIKLNMRGQCAS